ncbi:hypothetical protein THIOKS11820026 [Thiocapsa sp. KS1]|jgi:hypothetical protein|nr:hypothetical protein [Thiocapsa sp. KS1]CRI64237.1 hypothetical protein THIOKS11820026 [Thiocapsa sp. KS1]
MDPAVTGSVTDPLRSNGEAGVVAADWAQAAPRVAHYLRALGVRDPRDLDRLMESVRGRFERQVETILVADAIETGIEEASKLLDEWLAAELGPEVPGPMRGVARAVVLGGAVPGWVGVWSGRTPRPIADQIRASSLAPVPDPAPLTMATQRIDPCCHRLVRRIARLLRGLNPGPLHRRTDLGQST